MASNSLPCHLFVIFVLFDFFTEVASEYCGKDKYCESPYKCCIISLACCYDRDNSHYIRGFKLHVWNMWYFWLVVIFILVSCFGGCGYYRRRRLAAIQQTSSSTQSPRRVCTTRQRRVQPPSGLYVYNGPGADPGSNMTLPPPYLEVMQQPNLYPVNKVDLPPYPGPPRDKDLRHVGQGEEVSPPPYCEVAMPTTQPQEGCNSSAPTEHAAVPIEASNPGGHTNSTGCNISSTVNAGSS